MSQREMLFGCDSELEFKFLMNHLSNKTATILINDKDLSKIFQRFCNKHKVLFEKCYLLETKYSENLKYEEYFLKANKVIYEWARTNNIFFLKNKALTYISNEKSQATSDQAKMLGIQTEYGDDFQNKSSGCFIATAVLGNYNHPVVIDLRKFRDKYLLKSKGGNLFVKIYYFFSPSLSKLISNSKLLKLLSLKLLINPLHKFVKKKI